MSYWIFQGKKEDFDIDTYLRTFGYIYWSVKHPKHQELMKEGDEVFIWRSKGKSNNPYGTVAYGEIVEECTHKSKVKYPKNLLDSAWRNREISEFKVGIEVKTVRLSLEEGMIDSSIFYSDNILRKTQLITARQGTNFRLNRSEFNKIYNLWFITDTDPEEDEYETEEWKTKLRTHKIRERDPQLIKKSKANFIEKNGRLFCEACKFDFKETYGEFCSNFIEAHHKKPLSKIKANEKTKISDIGMLCANCHRAIHKIKTEDSWAKLFELLKNKY